MKNQLFERVMDAAFAAADSTGSSTVDLAVALRLLSDITFAANGITPRELDPSFTVQRSEFVRQAKKMLLDRGVDAHRIEEYLS